MTRYKDDELVGIFQRVEQCYYADLRLEQLKPAFFNHSLPMHQRFTVNKVSHYYSMSFFVHLSELFRFFKDDAELNKRLKTAPKQRLEFRKRIRDVAAKSHDFSEVRTKLIPYVNSMKSSGINWRSEFVTLLEYFKELLTERGEKAGPFFYYQSLRGLQAYVLANPPNLNYPMPDLKKDLLK